jgi:membrane fusion protein, multidrug efflux system
MIIRHDAGIRSPLVNLRRLMILLVMSAAGIGGGWFYYAYSRQHPSTADAYLGMHVVRVAPRVSGSIDTLAVRSHQRVHKGDLLFSIDPTPFELALHQADARLQQAKDTLAAESAQIAVAQDQADAAQANLREVQRHTARIRDLASKGTASKDARDAAVQALQDARDSNAAAQAKVTAAKAQRGASGDANAALKVARAARDQAQLDLKYTHVYAPANGILGELDLRPGSYVTAGEPLLALVETDDVWVDANFKETDLPRIRPGQPASVSVDLLPGVTLSGSVESLGPASGAAFSLLPPENATGNWVKVTQRFPVRVHIMHPLPDLRLGASSEVTIDTSGVAGQNRP